MTLEISFALVNVLQIKYILISEVKTYKDLYTQADINSVISYLLCIDLWHLK